MRPLRRCGGAAAILVAAFVLCALGRRAAAVEQAAAPRPELVLQTGHAQGTLWHVALSADGELLASGGRGDNAVRLWEAASGRQLRWFDSPARGRKLNSGVSAVAFGGGRRVLAAGFTDGSVVLWDVASGRELARFAALTTLATPFPVGVTTLWFDAAGHRLFAGGDPAGIRIFDVSSGREDGRVAGAPPPQFWLPQAMTPDAKVIVSLQSGGKGGPAVILQDAASGRATSTRSIEAAHGHPVIATPDGRVLVASAVGDALEVSDVRTGKRLRTLPVGGKLSPQAVVAFARDGRIGLAQGSTLTVWAADGSTPLFSQTTGVPVTFPQADAITAFEFSEDGRRVAVATLAGTIVVLDAGNGREVARLRGDVNAVYSVAFSDDGERLFAGARTVWDFRAGQAEALVPGSGPVLTAVSADGRVVAVAGPNSGKVDVWDAVEKRQVTSFSSPGPFDVGRVAVSTDGTRVAVSYVLSAASISQAMQNPAALASSGLSGTGLPILIGEVASGKVLRTITPAAGAEAVASQLQFSPDGKQLTAILNGQPAPFVVDVVSGKPLPALAPAAAIPPAYAEAMANMRKMMRKMSPEQVKRMEGMLGQAMAMRQSVARELGSAAYSPDGRFLALGVNASIEIWEVAAAKQVATIAGHEAGIAQVTYTRDGKTLIAADDDNTISVWDVTSGKEIRTVGRSPARVLAMAVSPAGRLLATTHADGAIRLWDVSRGEAAATLLSVSGGADWLAVMPDGRFDGSPEAWNAIAWRFGGNTFDMSPVEIFFNEYYYPDLLGDVLAGRRPQPIADIATKDRRQPQLAIEVAGEPPAGDATVRDTTLRIRVGDAPAGARDLRLFRNGSLVRIWHGDVTQGAAEASVRLVAGPNHFTAYAFNRDNVKSRDATADVTGASSLARRGVAHVLAVGIDQYENPDYNLRYAVADARSFATDVKAQLDKLDRFDRVDVTHLLDRDATKAAIVKSVAGLAARVQPEDEVLVFVASHGTAAGDRFYLIPTDLGYRGTRAELDEAAAKTILEHGISDQDLEAAFEGVNARRLLFVIDACNSGQALEAEEQRRGPMNSKGLAQLAYEKGMYVLTASQSYQAAQEVSELGHGLLTYALVNEGLDKAAADDAPADGRVVVREWLQYATSRVPRLQVEKIEDARKAGRQLRFSSGPRGGGAEPPDADTQHPRVFFRRELDEAAWVVATHR